jgi:phosphoglycolate phosphatase-like HAD superfamily hydrolase
MSDWSSSSRDAEPTSGLDSAGRAARAALFDVDGTLVDSNYHNVIAWSRAFADVDLYPPLWRIHRAIGMGGDQLIPAVAGDRAEQDHGDDLRAGWRNHYDKLLPEVRPFSDAVSCLEAIRRRGFIVVLASSAPAQHLEHYLDLLDCRELIDVITTSDDVEVTKPAGDLIEVALRKAATSDAVITGNEPTSGPPVMVGDSPWDVVAAAKAGVPTICVRTGGFGTAELVDAGAVNVFDALADLTEHIDQTPFRAR